MTACSPTAKRRSCGKSAASSSVEVALKQNAVGVVAPEVLLWPEQRSTVPTCTSVSVAFVSGLPSTHAVTV